MSVQSRHEGVVKPAAAPSIHVVRARKLLLGGAIGGVSAAVLCLIGFGIGYGWSGVISAALAAAMVLFFYGVGQYVMVLFADAGARTLLSVALCSYTARVVVLGLALLLYHKHAESWPLLPTAVFLTTVVKNITDAVQKAVVTGAGGQPLSPTPGYLGTLENNGVQLAPYNQFDSKVDAGLKAEVEKLKADIIAGTVKVESANAPK